MRRGSWKVSLPRNICVFCAIRIQNAFATAPSSTRRRLFTSTRALKKPPAGAAVAAKKQDADDDDWASWTPPAEVFRPRHTIEAVTPKNSPALERQAVRESSRTSKRKSGIQEGSSAWRFHGVQASGAHNDRSGMRDWNSEGRLSTSQRTGSGVSDIGFAGGDNNWQGLRRRTPAFGSQKARWRDHPTGHAPNDKSNRSEEQMKRIEASKHGEYVGLGGLQRRNSRSFRDNIFSSANPLSGLDTGSNGSPGPQKQSAATSPYSVTSPETEQPLVRMTDSKSPHSPFNDDRARKAPQSQQMPAQTQMSNSFALYSPMISHDSSMVNQPSLKNLGSKKSTEYQTEESGLADPAFDSSGRKSRPQGEIQVPLFHGRNVRNMNKELSVDRRKERKRSVPSRNAADDYDLDDDELAARRAARKQKVKWAKEKEKQSAPPTPIFLPEFISVSNLAGVLKVRVEDFLRKMVELGFDGMTNDHVLDAETAGLVAAEYNFEPIIDRSEEQDLKAQPPVEDKLSLPPRPPVVTIMGHVDHGKTTLLDFLRKSSVAASEHGGITQHIGAFSVPMSGGRLVTFLDTPGHAAFLSMRQRGANVTDIVILVVAADDSVKPQTVEAIKHAQTAKVPIIVAVNKIDKEDARPEQVRQDLARYGVEIEDYGGDTQVVCVSGKTGQGMAELEAAAVALADILDMRAPTDGLAEGWVLEATTKKAGRVATVLVRRGTLHPGDVIVAGTSWARVRSLRNEAGVMVDSAGPGTPVEIDGWREQPIAGDEVLQPPSNSEQQAKSVIHHRLEASRREQLAKDMTAVNEARRMEQDKREQLERAKELAEANLNGTPTEDADADAESSEAQKADETPRTQEVFLILKADVSGSVEAVENAVTGLGTSEIRARILRSGVGPITEFDIEHAAVAAGHIINFNTPIDGSLVRLAEEKGVGIMDQSIIYRLIDQVKALLAERLPRLVTQRVLGEAEIAQVFEINVRGRVQVPVAGCRVRNGEIGRKAKVRVLREGKVVFDGSLSSLKNVKKDITEARKGMDCGIGFDGWTEFKVGDQVQCYEEKSEPRSL